MNSMNTWFKIDEKIRFLIIGSLNACISYFIYALICFLFGKEIYQLALVLAWALSSVSSFFMQKLLVFQTKGNYLKEYIKCCGTWFVSYLVNAFLLEMFVSKIHLNVYISQFIATFMAAVVTYVFFKVFVFIKKC
ncbi:TPA: hypothetical protein CPT80_03625 [Candidatus Gastranaerophilales bacterium HUM_9]|nr:MAG TPA: hypothetical protein CPT80_03625 [Candidatus Gastranaerophilales bacterium HUM_9]HBX35388.1 hypothetical protein [Cyanobacteria bacterium UBA11440]